MLSAGNTVTLPAAGRVFATIESTVNDVVALKQPHVSRALLGLLDSLNGIAGGHALVKPFMGLECRLVSEQNFHAFQVP